MIHHGGRTINRGWLNAVINPWIIGTIWETQWIIFGDGWCFFTMYHISHYALFSNPQTIEPKWNLEMMEKTSLTNHPVFTCFCILLGLLRLTVPETLCHSQPVLALSKPKKRQKGIRNGGIAQTRNNSSNPMSSNVIQSNIDGHPMFLNTTPLQLDGR